MRLPVHLGTVGLLFLPVAYGAFVVWQEVQFRQHLAGPPQVDALISAAPVREALDTTAVASVLGLLPGASPQASIQSLSLRACFVASRGLSKALLADAQGQRLYRVGDRLPGGSTLRRVEGDHVVLWNKGREERLMLQPAGSPFLLRLEPGNSAPVRAISMRFLRPMSW